MMKDGRFLAVAESCTGGLVNAMLSSVPGASRWFLGGVVAYSDRLKEKLVGVPLDTIAEYGAVSRETVEAMARGVRETTGAEVSMAVTGIAGPGGGSREKPVGTVWMAVCGSNGVFTWSEKFTGTREEVRRRASRCVLEMMARRLEDGGA